jgi:hypothetical protein
MLPPEKKVKDASARSTPQQVSMKLTGFDTNPKKASVIVSASFGHSRNSSFELNALKPCPAWMTPY